MTLTNFAQAEVTGKAVPPGDSGCPAVTVNSVNFANGFGFREWTGNTTRGQTVVCVTDSSENDAVTEALGGGNAYTLTTSTNFYVLEQRSIPQAGGGTQNRTGVASSGILQRFTVTMTEISVSVSVRTETSVSISVMTQVSVSVSVSVRAASPDNGGGSDGTGGTVVQVREKVDNKRALQYAAGGVAAFVLIHNWIITDPAKALPFHLAFNEKGGIYSGTSWRLTPQETIHFSALESLDDKRGHYKFGVQWHYQFAPPQGITETPKAALPAIYTMPNVKPKDWLNE